MTHENGRTSAVVVLAAPSLEDAQKLAGTLVQENHSCDGRCGRVDELREHSDWSCQPPL
jgi:hypothetical protein